MMFTSLLAATALASQASAFLVPLEVAKAMKTVEDSLHVSLVNQKSQFVSLRCPGCYFDTANDHQMDYSAQPENELALNFTVNDADNTIAMNGERFYPVSSPLMVDLYASLVRNANGIESPPIHLGFALEYLPFHETSEGNIIPIHLTILDLDGVQIKAPSVTINMIKLPTQELLIANVETIPFEDTPGAQCATTICRIKAMMAARIREMLEGARATAHKAGSKIGMGGCHKAAGAAPQFHGKMPGHRRPHMHGHGHGHHGHRHPLQKFVHKAVHLFIIPAMLGIVGGLTASAIGMFVGQLIVFVWFRFVRGGRRGTARSQQEAGLEEEKEPLAAEGADAPPLYEETYEDAPQYEAAQALVDGEEKH